MNSRRDALRTIAVGTLGPALLHGQQTGPQPGHQHAEALLQPTIAQLPKNIGPEDFNLLSQVVDLIIPRTDTPGAADAGVPMFIDRAITKRPELGPTLKAGLAGFRGADGLAHMQELESRRDPFFTLIKNLTIDGYYTSRDGLVKELGYHGNTYLKEFVGCTHPEHQNAD